MTRWPGSVTSVKDSRTRMSFSLKSRFITPSRSRPLSWASPIEKRRLKSWCIAARCSRRCLSASASRRLFSRFFLTSASRSWRILVKESLTLMTLRIWETRPCASRRSSGQHVEKFSNSTTRFKSSLRTLSVASPASFRHVSTLLTISNLFMLLGSLRSCLSRSDIVEPPIPAPRKKIRTSRLDLQRRGIASTSS